jgi:hypothetical protein
VTWASGTLTKSKSYLSLCSTSANVTTNELTTLGFARTNATIQNYVAPSSLGGTFSVDAYKSITATGSGTVYGAGLFDSTTVSGSFLYVEDNFSSNAVVVTNDIVTTTVTITN